MKPSIARRPTSCDFCGEVIEPGSDRLDDVIKTPNFYKRLHYHPNCYTIKITKWYDDNRDKVIVHPHSGGWPLSNLSPEQREARQKWLIRLANLVKYYTPRLQLHIPPSELSPEALRQFNNFALRFQLAKDSLEPLGGLPDRYQNLGIPPKVEEQLVSISEVAVSSFS